MTIERTIIVGDIHGCIDEFEEFVRAIEYRKSSDRLILLGDLIDRGPDSPAVVRKAREMKLECVKGNHEHSFLRYCRNKNFGLYSNQSYYHRFSDEDIDYMEKMPTFIKLNEKTVLVHAGLRPGISFSEQSNDDMMYIRYLDRYNLDFDSSYEEYDYYNRNFWTKFWKGPESVIYGHNIHSLEFPKIEKLDSNVFCYGLDTGCCFGGYLTGLIFETKEIVQVKSKFNYHNSYPSPYSYL